MSGSGAAGGFDFQAEVMAYVLCHAAAGHPLADWSSTSFVPVAASAETGGPGDDLRVESNALVVEAQAKRGLNRGVTLWEALRRLWEGLGRDPNLRGVLVVDGSASGTVRDDLRKELQRLADGRFGPPAKAGKELVDDLLRELGGADGHDARFRRLRVVQLELAEGQPNRALAVGLLAGLLSEPVDAQHWWRTLAKYCLERISNSGRVDVDAVLNLAPGPLRADAVHGAAAGWASIRRRLRADDSVAVPGLSVRLPLDRCRTTLRPVNPPAGGNPAALARTLARYHEWDRLRSGRGYGGKDDFAGHAVLDHADRAVAVGGPGAGKSTLTRRLAWEWSGRGARVLRVRLPRALRIADGGTPFGESLLAAGTGGTGLTPAVRGTGGPATLLADGLDECGTRAGEVAGWLGEWAAADAARRVLVTTRPVGYDPSWLPGFQHFDLLPLTHGEARRAAGFLLRECLPDDPDRAAALLRDLVGPSPDEPYGDAPVSRGRAEHAAAVAARSPLLLGFLIRLALAGVEPGGSRVKLYEQVLSVIRDAPPPDREAPAAAGIEDDVLDAAAFRLVGGDPADRPTLIRSVADALCPGDGLAGRERVGRALRFWTDRGLLEEVSAGPRSAVTFVHLNLAEFAAARRLAGLPADDLRSAVGERGRDPRWRQPVQMAAALGRAGEIVTGLLPTDDPSDPASVEAVEAVEAVAAAAAVAEAGAGGRVPAVMPVLAARIASPVRLIALEAAAAALPLCDLAPAAVADAVAHRLDDPQRWTRLAARALTAAAGRAEHAADDIEGWLADALGGNEPRRRLTLGLVLESADQFFALAGVGDAELKLRDALRPVALEALAALPGRAAAEAILDRVTAEAWERGLRGTDGEAVWDLCERAGYTLPPENPLARSRANLERSVGDIERSWERSQAFARFVAEMILEAAGDPGDIAPSSDFAALGRVVETAAVGKQAASICNRPFYEPHRSVLAEVFRLAIAAAGVDPAAVAADAAAFLDPDAPEEHRRLPDRAAGGDSDDAPDGEEEFTPDWSRAAAAGPALDLLWAEGVGRHAPLAALVLRELVSRPECRAWAAATVPGGLDSDVGGQVLFATRSAPDLIGRAEVVRRLKNRLAGATGDAVHFLLKLAVEAAEGGPDGLIRELAIPLTAALGSDSAETARLAAETLAGADLWNDPDVQRAARSSLDRWTASGVPCRTHGGAIRGGSCPHCSAVPPNPRGPLLSLLGRAGRVGADELLTILGRDAKDFDARCAAADLLASRAADDHAFAADLLDRAAAGGLPDPALAALLNQGKIVRDHAARVAVLLSHPRPEVRAAALDAYGARPKPDGTPAAVDLLADPDAHVRDAAARAVRQAARD